MGRSQSACDCVVSLNLILRSNEQQFNIIIAHFCYSKWQQTEQKNDSGDFALLEEETEEYVDTTNIFIFYSRHSLSEFLFKKIFLIRKQNVFVSGVFQKDELQKDEMHFIKMCDKFTHLIQSEKKTEMGGFRRISKCYQIL